ncbi:hypothetical protein [Actinoplanes subglobosus]|uniref:Uncharacterized protein n=1 Tax=Actinoplanes subglobosus TaxID=1547892 RepID=A0ABV8J970_9ACTN
MIKTALKSAAASATGLAAFLSAAAYGDAPERPIIVVAVIFGVIMVGSLLVAAVHALSFVAERLAITMTIVFGVVLIAALIVLANYLSRG